LNRNRNNLEIIAKGKYLPSIKEFIGMVTTFCLTVFAWVFFRAENIGHALDYISKIFSSSLLTMPEIQGKQTIIILVVCFMLIEWVGREQQYAIARLGCNLPQPIRWAIYYFFILAIFGLGHGENQFIYFQF
jgi:hypothetical protein